MKFDKIMEYQKIDQELLALESEVGKSNERKMMTAAKSRLDNATEVIGKLSQEASELLSGYAKMTNKIDKLQAKLDEFDGIIDEVADTAEADYYIRQIGAIAEELSLLEREAGQGAFKVDEINVNYKKTWEIGTKSSEAYKAARVDYENFVRARQPKVAEINSKLNALKKEIDPKFLNIYLSLRQAKKLPAFVEYNPETNTCGRCFMDLPNDAKSKLKNAGDYCECPNCRRLLFIPD